MLDGMIAGVNGPEERDGRLTAAGPDPVRRPLDGSFSRTGRLLVPLQLSRSVAVSCSTLFVQR